MELTLCSSFGGFFVLGLLWTTSGKIEIDTQEHWRETKKIGQMEII